MTTVVVSIIIFSLVFMVLLILTAPEGYEDDEGFHYGRPEDEE